MTTLKYRKATCDDTTAISLLWAEYFDYHHSIDPTFKRKPDSEKGIADFLSKAVNDDNTYIGIAQSDSEIVGYIWCEIDKKPPCFEKREYGLISDIAVSKESRGKGIASELLKLGMTWFGTKDIDHVETRVLLSNPSATKFWEKSKFEPFMTIMRYKLNS